MTSGQQDQPSVRSGTSFHEHGLQRRPCSLLGEQQVEVLQVPRTDIRCPKRYLARDVFAAAHADYALLWHSTMVRSAVVRGRMNLRPTTATRHRTTR